MGRIEPPSAFAIDRRTITAEAQDRIVRARDALRCVAELIHPGAPEAWCDELPVSRGDLSALIAQISDELEGVQD